MSGQNAATMRKLLEDGFSKGDLGVVDELVDPECREHQRGLRPGAEGVKDTIRTLRTWFSDFRLAVEDVAEVGDKVWVRVRASGTHTGPIMGRPATGKRVELDVIDVGRFEDGKLVEHWGVPDQLGMMLQLGLIGGRPVEGS